MKGPESSEKNMKMIKMTNPHNRNTGLDMMFHMKCELFYKFSYTVADVILLIIMSAGLSVELYGPQFGLVELV